MPEALRHVLRNPLERARMRTAMERLYALMLDFFPLVDEIARENAAIGSALQAIALESLLVDDAQELAQARVLLRLAGDLGYASPEVVRFLLRELDKTLREDGGMPQA